MTTRANAPKLAAVITLVVMVLVFCLSLRGQAQAWSGPAAHYDSNWNLEAIFWQHLAWGNGVPGAQPDPNGRYCVHPNFAVGERLTLSANGLTVSCTIGDSVASGDVGTWFGAGWAVELDYWTFHELGLGGNNWVTVSAGGSPAPPPPPAPEPEPPAPPPPPLTFAETGQSVAHGFKDFFLTYGGVRVFGYPTTGEFVAADTGLITQCFQRMSLEYQPTELDWAVRGRFTHAGCPAEVGHANE